MCLTCIIDALHDTLKHQYNQIVKIKTKIGVQIVLEMQKKVSDLKATFDSSPDHQKLIFHS